MAIEVIFIVAAWAIQIGAVLVLALVISLIGKSVEEVTRKRTVKLLPRTLIVFLLLCAVLAVFAVSPPVICAWDIAPELLERVQSGANGLYSWKIPLVPVCVKVTGLENCVIDGKMEYMVKFSVYYFCVGKLQMECYTYDGYNAYPMFGL